MGAVEFVGLEPAHGRKRRIAATAMSFVATALYGGEWNHPKDIHSPMATMATATTTSAVDSSLVHVDGDINSTGNGLERNNNEYESESFCHTKGSLHQLALNMINHTSPPGSPSYKKLKHVLDLRSDFYIDMGGGHGIFSKNQEMMARMLRGVGLRQLANRPTDPQNVTLVDSFFTNSICPLLDENCRNQPRIHIQTEQKIKWHLINPCHESPNCVILEFSDYNLEKAKDQNKDVLDSLVLLPVMTQVPSRMSAFEPTHPKNLQNRSIDMVFIGLITNRRTGLTKGADVYREAHPDRKVVIQKNNRIAAVGNLYPEAKVCLIAHSYTSISGGEYHRYSEFAPFGCIPVIEHFADTFGIQSYEKCGGAIFTNLTNIIPTAAHVVESIDQGLFGDRANDIVNWWKTGIRWETILPQILV